MEIKRYEIYAMRNDESGIAIIGTVHNKKDFFRLVFQALKSGFDFIGYTEY